MFINLLTKGKHIACQANYKTQKKQYSTVEWNVSVININNFVPFFIAN